ncbi:MAG: uroporphyrinogen decarboxylase [Acidobacteria bacterium]|nr:uroporphyrinogen decarboxylase [Acidobacteriota bacterium]
MGIAGVVDGAAHDPTVYRETVSPSASPSPFLDACRRLPVEHVPVWFMRQAGRSLPEYRALREKHPRFSAVIEEPELAAEVTLQPVRRHGVDAAILFSDIMTPVQAIVPGVDIHPGKGPVVDEPFRTKADLDRLRPIEPEADLPYVLEAVRLVRAELPPEVALIGFAGAPFTVASYLVEGGKSNDYRHTKALMYGAPDVWAELAGRLADITLATLRAQVAAGAQAVQLFDSWAGNLSAADYARHVLPFSTRIFEGLADLDVPRIHFGVGTMHLVDQLSAAGADVIGIDWRTPMADARRIVGPDKAVQGNLDPTVLFAPVEVIEERTRAVLADAGPEPGHVFNLGWGVLPDTDADALTRVVDIVHGA